MGGGLWGGPHFRRGGHGVALGIGFVLGFVCNFRWGGRWGGHGVAKFSSGVAMGWPLATPSTPRETSIVHSGLIFLQVLLQNQSGKLLTLVGIFVLTDGDFSFSPFLFFATRLDDAAALSFSTVIPPYL